MFSLDPADTASSQAVFGMIAFIILNVVVTLFLFNKYMEEKRKNRLLNKAASGVDTAIVEFFSTQFNHTKSHNRAPENIDNQLHKEVVQLRSAYLKIEEKAIAKTIGSPHYWHYLDENLRKLIKIVFPQAVSRNQEVAELENKISLLKDRINHIPNANGNKKVEQHKARAIASLEHILTQPRKAGYNKEKLQQQLDKLESVVGVFEDPKARKRYLVQATQREYLNKSERHADKLARISDKSTASIDVFESNPANSAGVSTELTQFKSDNESLARQITQLKQELKRFKDQLPTDAGIAFDDNGDARPSAYDFNDITEELIESNEKEIDRLRDIIANQRSSIFEMEESLTSLEKLNHHDNTDNHSEIDQLKRCISESEVCISMLEQELNTLRDDLGKLREQKLGGDLSEAESKQLSQEVKQLKSEIDASHHQISAFEQLSNYTGAALAASSVEDVALLVYETIVSLNYTPLLLIKAPERTIQLAPHGSITVREKVIINNMHINEITPGPQGRVDFRFLQIAGIIRPPEEFEINDSDQQLIIKILKLTDKIITLVALAQKAKHHARTRDDTINAIKRVSGDLDKLIEDHGNKSKTAVTRNFKQISDFMRAKGMTATQVAAIHSIEQETIKQIDSTKNLRLRSRKDFLGLIRSIEEAN